MVEKEDVLAAIQEILNEGGKLTRKTVTQRIGGGSPNEIGPVIKRFKKRRQRRPPQEVKDLVAAYLRLSPLDQKIFQDVVQRKTRGQG